jgi:hypothetical protein
MWMRAHRWGDSRRFADEISTYQARSPPKCGSAGVMQTMQWEEGDSTNGVTLE